MIIDANTKIGAIIKNHPEAMEAIISIHFKLEKLRNPILRKVIASRTSILNASRMVGCSVEDFFAKLQPLGFEINRQKIDEADPVKSIPEFMKNLEFLKVIELDVRPIFDEGKDPLTVILQKIKEVNQGEILKLINRFEPTPLMALLENKGFESYTKSINDNLTFTYFFKTVHADFKIEAKQKSTLNNWDEILHSFDGKIKKVDVRDLEMPQPMFTILEALDVLPNDYLLFVNHKKIPVFLLPELEEKKFNYRIKEVNSNTVEMLIFKNEF